MGLDSVELIVELEDTFQTTIPDAAAEMMRTPQDAADWLAMRLSPPARPAGVCASARTFRELRAGLGHAFGVVRTSVRPDARVADLVPDERRRGWPRFARQYRLSRPPLRLWGERFVPAGTTVRDLVADAQLRRPDACFDTNGNIMPDAVLLRVRRITAEQMRLPLDEVRPDSRFVQDLGMG